MRKYVYAVICSNGNYLDDFVFNVYAKYADAYRDLKLFEELEQQRGGFIREFRIELFSVNDARIKSFLKKNNMI